MQKICAKDHGGPKWQSVVPFEILHSKGPFEVASFEHFGLVPPFNMAAMIVFTSEGDIFRLERTDTPHVKMPNFTAEKTCLQPGSKNYFLSM